MKMETMFLPTPYERPRDREELYRGDVTYEVYRRGGDYDRINDERVLDHFRNGDQYEVAANDELRRQKELADFRRMSLEDSMEYDYLRGEQP